MLSKVSGAILLSSAALADVHDEYTRHLKFNADGSFKVVTFSDLGLNESSEDYLQTQGLIESVLNSEKPDFVVITGDIVDPKHSDDYSYHFSSALELIKARRIPWTWTGGNKIEGKSMSDLHEVDYSYGMDLSWTGYFWDMHQESPRGKTYEQEDLGYFTSRIPIMSPNGRKEVFSIYTLDTSAEYCKGLGLPGETCITSAAIDWFSDQQHLYSHNYHLHDFVFLHKPIPQFMNLANLYDVSGHKQQAVGCQAIDNGLFGVALESKKVIWINAGGDADNDFSGRYHNEMMFSYARKSGFGGEGSLPRGVRSFLLTLNHDGTMHGISNIIEAETGIKSTDMNMHSPPSFNFSRQTQCSVDPFASLFDSIFEDELIQ